MASKKVSAQGGRYRPPYLSLRSEENEKTIHASRAWLTLGAGIGTAVAFVLGSGGVWLAVGLALGVAIGVAMAKRTAGPSQMQAVRSDK